jgi:hypothetical protein
MGRTGTKLAKAVQIYLEILRVVCLIGVIAIPIVTLWMASELPDVRPERAPELPVLVRFNLDESVFSTVGEPGEQLVRGEGELLVRSKSVAAWMLALGVIELILLAALYAACQLRAVFRSVTRGRPFAPENASRVRRVGFVVLGWNVLAPLLKYFVGMALISDIRVHGLVLRPPIDFNPESLFLGLATIVLAEIFRQASLLEREQSLTV